MYIKQLEIKNFRGIPHLILEFHKQTNILIGNNGMGKTSILDCLAILLSRFFGRLISSTGTGRLFTKNDITNGESLTTNTLSLSLHEKEYAWTGGVARHRLLRSRKDSHNPLNNLVASILTQLEENKDSNIPIAVYYPVNRAVLDIPLRIRTRHVFDQISACDQALTGKRNDFRTFFEWFRHREDIENENYRSKKGNYVDKQLQSVRNAIESFMPGFKNLRVNRAPLRMILEKEGEKLEINQLSDGEKCLLALLGDLARRLAIANPSLDDPLQGEGVVLVDEIDLHLHPYWQRYMVENLEKTFPRCQFILTTHSPQIVSHVKPHCLWILKRIDQGFTATRPEDSYGRDTNRILEDIMEVPSRPQKIKDRLSNLFISIDKGKINQSRKEMESIRKEIGDDPELIKANILIHRKEIIGK